MPKRPKIGSLSPEGEGTDRGDWQRCGDRDIELNSDPETPKDRLPLPGERAGVRGGLTAVSGRFSHLRATMTARIGAGSPSIVLL